MAYPKGYTPPEKKFSEVIFTNRKWIAMVSILISAALCYILGELDILILMGGSETISTFPLSFIVTLIGFGFTFFIFLSLLISKLHAQFIGEQ